MKELKKSHLKLVKFFSNGVTHNLILWIISKEPIHGYGIMKKLDEFFEFTSDNCELKSSSIKVYPKKRKMEDNGLILGEWKTVNNKRLKFYSITEDGEIVLNHIRNNIVHVLENPNWLDFIEDMTGKKLNW